MEEKLSRREVREGAFIILYQTLFGAAAINEAVELGKKYAYKQDCNFINGVLNSYLEEFENARD